MSYIHIFSATGKCAGMSSFQADTIRCRLPSFVTVVESGSLASESKNYNDFMSCFVFKHYIHTQIIIPSKVCASVNVYTCTTGSYKFCDIERIPQTTWTPLVGKLLNCTKKLTFLLSIKSHLYKNYDFVTCND